MNKNVQMTSSRVGMARTMIGVCALIIPLVISACSPSTGTPTPNAPMATTTPVATDTLQTMQDTATPTPIDPCVLVDSQAASAFTGATFGQGVDTTTSGGGRICTYGANTANIFEVFVGQEKDEAAANADEQSFLNDLQTNLAQLTSEGMNITQMPTFADGAVMADISFTISGTTLNGRAMGARKGTIFLGLSDLIKGGQVPSNDQFQTEMQNLIGQLP